MAQVIHSFDLKKAPLYFDGYYGSRLVPELASRFKISPKQISAGYGVEFFLRAIFDSCDPAKDVVLTNAPHYGFYSVYAKAKKVSLATFGVIDKGDRFVFDIDGCLKKIKSLQPKIILITSPNNPTGNSIAATDFAKILRGAKKDTLVVLDEAYWGFDEKYDEATILRLLKKNENLVILRSFSKRYALAGLRIGYALWGTRAKTIIRYDDLYLGGSRLLEDVAVAALQSESYYRNLSRTIIAERNRFTARVNRLKHFKAYQSNANFILVKVEKRMIPVLEKRLARLDAAISKFVMPEFMRVSLGSKKDTTEFLHVLRVVDKY